MNKIDRTNEEEINNFGSKMIIIEYRTNKDIDVYFPEFNYIVKNQKYINFKNRIIKCPYEPRVYGHGYIGEGKYKVSKNGKHTLYYSLWKSMLNRCYSEIYQEKYPTYKGCIVCNEWLNFQNFAKWFEENYYEVDGEKMCLDKDILVKGNKIYSPSTCIFVPNRINVLFVKSDKMRGDLPIGVFWDNNKNKYIAQCNANNKRDYLGSYNTSEEAFQSYKTYKENYIKKIADEYKLYIPQKLYDAMYRYEIEITD